MSTRAKFMCLSIKKYQSNWWDTKHEKTQPGFLYEYEFQAVSGTSEENNQFFASTPSGNLKMAAVRDDLFAPGESYYLDFSPAAK